jgi:hypothetical protein
VKDKEREVKGEGVGPRRWAHARLALRPEVTLFAARVAAAQCEPPSSAERTSLLGCVKSLSEIPQTAALHFIEFLSTLEEPSGAGTVSPRAVDAAQRTARGFIPPVVAATLQSRRYSSYNVERQYVSNAVVNPTVALSHGLDVPNIVRDLTRGSTPKPPSERSTDQSWNWPISSQEQPLASY